MATVEDVRSAALGLPRSCEVWVRGRRKYRVGRYVWLAFSADEETFGFAFPKDERAALVASYPERFALPGTSDLRFHWVVARLAALAADEVRELVEEAWRMVVPKKVAREHLGA